jgi:outer membrane protein OmpA-like peptidoglycan-associated protein
MPRFWASLAGLMIVATSASAAAQEFDVDNFRASSPGDGELMAVQTGHLAASGTLALSVLFGVEKNVLVAVDESGRRVAELVGTRAGGDLAAAYGFGRLELGAALPLVMYQDGHVDAGTPMTAAGGQGIGDLRLQLRGRLYGDGGVGFGVAGALLVTLPTANVDFGGDASPSVSPRLIFELRGERAVLAVNLGGRVRESQELPMGRLSVGSAFTYGAGLAVRVPRLDAVTAMAEVDGESSGARLEESPLEARAGVRVRAAEGLSIAGGYGRGLVFGYGAPDHRVFVSATWRPEGKRTPHPAALELAQADAPPAPRQPPPNPDPDGDGILGAADGCPEAAEDFDGFEDRDGCPEADNDHDGLADAADKCPNHAEDMDSHDDADGCPDPDNDHDGLVDSVDQCPNEAEIINGNQDDDGCPDQGKQLVVVHDTRIEIKDKLYFATGKDVILPRSEPVLAQLALTLQRNPWIKSVRIEGHTDDQGDDRMNQDLSQRRATSVRQALIARGIAPERLEAVGYGESQPIDSNRSVDGRAHNRRTEFVITAQDDKSALAPEVK